MAREKGTKVNVDGIDVVVNVDTANDFEIVEMSAIANDPYATGSEKLSATIRVYKLLLGKDYRRVKDELREKNGGKLPVETMIGFIANVIAEAGKAKNSGCSEGN